MQAQIATAVIEKFAADLEEKRQKLEHAETQKKIDRLTRVVAQMESELEFLRILPVEIVSKASEIYPAMVIDFLLVEVTKHEIATGDVLPRPQQY